MEDNKTIINRIKNSGFTQDQKDHLIDLLPFMNDAQKQALLELIQKSNQVIAG